MSQPKSAGKSRLFFMKHFFSAPRGVGSLVPSSRALARAMVANLNFEAGDTVVELGPGTGVFTRALLEHGVPPENLILVEYNEEFAQFLSSQFLNLKIVKGDAANLPALLRSIGLDKVKRIVSGIPMRNLDVPQRDAITTAIAASLVTGGVVVQFTYVGIPPLGKIAAHLGGLVGRRAAWAMNNLPPAFVWRYVKS